LHRQLTHTFALQNPKAIHLLPREHGEIWERLEVRREKCAVLEHNSGNIYDETRKDRGTVTMVGIRNSPTLFRTVPSLTSHGLLFLEVGGF